MNDRHQWSCEHCGRDTRDAERPCDYCGSGMCERCTDKHDADGVCPSTAPVGVPAASVRDAQLALKAEGSASRTKASGIHDDNLLACDEHGMQPWNGQIICEKDFGGCGRVWHLGDESHELHPPADLGTDCACGKPLSGAAESPARAICSTCFQDAYETVNEAIASLKSDADQSSEQSCPVGPSLPDSKWSIERVSDRIVLHCTANGVTVALRMGVDGTRNLAATLLSRADMLELRRSPIHTVDYQESTPVLSERSEDRGGFSPDWDEHD